jgi:hypothetical protein
LSLLHQTGKVVINSVVRLIALFGNIHSPRTAPACVRAGGMTPTIADS